MALFDIDGTGEREYIASVYTMMIYEQEFGSSLVKDFFGRIESGGGGDEVSASFVKEQLRRAMPDGRGLPKTTEALVDKAFPASRSSSMDFTKTNWDAALKAMWAMARTADAVNDASTVPAWKKWAASLGAVNLGEIVAFVMQETQRGLFRA